MKRAIATSTRPEQTLIAPIRQTNPRSRSVALCWAIWDACPLEEQPVEIKRRNPTRAIASTASAAWRGRRAARKYGARPGGNQHHATRRSIPSRTPPLLAALRAGDELQQR